MNALELGEGRLAQAWQREAPNALRRAAIAQGKAIGRVLAEDAG